MKKRDLKKKRKERTESPLVAVHKLFNWGFFPFPSIYNRETPLTATVVYLLEHKSREETATSYIINCLDPETDGHCSSAIPASLTDAD